MYLIYLNANNPIVDIIKKLHKSFIAITQAESESSTVESGVLARSMVCSSRSIDTYIVYGGILFFSWHIRRFPPFIFLSSFSHIREIPKNSFLKAL